MRSISSLKSCVLGVLAVWTVLPLAAMGEEDPLRFRGPDGELLPFTDEAEVLDFLTHAGVVSAEEVEGGTSRTLKVLLEQDGVSAYAAFRFVDRRKAKAQLGKKRLLGFHDSYRYEVAAYVFSRLLGLDSVPPAVLRRLDGAEGSIQIWIEEAMTETRRSREQKSPPDSETWAQQRHTMRLFDRLIYNYDRNTGNILIDVLPDGNWRLWMIDHTRSFSTAVDVDGINSVTLCDRGLWERLRALEETELRERLDPYLTSRQIRAVLKRRLKVIAYVEALIDLSGAGAVIF
jgi:hypothetical protein